MHEQMEQPECQLHSLERFSQPPGKVEVAWQFKSRLKRMIKRRVNYISNRISEAKSTRLRPLPAANSSAGKLHPGDRVRVRSKEEIRSTLDDWNQLKGCAFLEEMWPYCDTSQRVLKQVRQFLDERDYRVKRCKGIVLLEGAICQGTKDFGTCDRSCFFFWREEWLEKID